MKATARVYENQVTLILLHTAFLKSVPVSCFTACTCLPHASNCRFNDLHRIREGFFVPVPGFASDKAGTCGATCREASAKVTAGHVTDAPAAAGGSGGDGDGGEGVG